MWVKTDYGTLVNIAEAESIEIISENRVTTGYRLYVKAIMVKDPDEHIAHYLADFECSDDGEQKAQTIFDYIASRLGATSIEHMLGHDGQPEDADVPY